MGEPASKYEGKSRTEYSTRNTAVAMITRVVAILMGYFTRVVFTQTLANDYVAINGLFTDILNVLALSELGVGTAITYALYKPIAEKDREKQKALMQLYKRIYQGVALFVLVAGLSLVPFMGFLFKSTPQVEHLILIYLLYLLNSVLSYLLIYKKTLIDAHQLNYISVGYQTAFLILQDCLQIAVLLLTKNFLLFVSVMIACTIGNNLAISIKAQKMYPYLNEKKIDLLTKEEKGDITKNIKAMLMHKVGNVVVNNTDNLLLNKLVGTVSVACYSNYFLVIGSVRQVLTQMFQGIMASVGNMGVMENKTRIRKVFEASFFIGQWVHGVASICLFEVLDLFIGFSFGEQYVFERGVTLALCISFYLNGMRQATVAFRDSLGVFYYDRYKALAEAVINLVVSLILGYYFGAIGVFVGTIVSTVTTSLWVEPYMFYKHRLEYPVRWYFLKYAIYASVTAGLWVVCDLICRPVTGMTLGACILRALICMVIINTVYLLLYFRTDEFSLLERKAMRLLFKKFGGEDRERKQFAPEHLELLRLLRQSLTGQKEPDKATTADYEKVLEIAADHNVITLMYDTVMEEDCFSEKSREKVTKMAVVLAEFNYRLLFVSKEIIDLLKAAGIDAVLVKGAATAEYYPVPEMRKSSDVDIVLLHSQQMEEAARIMRQAGFQEAEKQHALHHVVFEIDELVSVEIHTMLAEPFDNNKVNRYISKLTEDDGLKVVTADVCGLKLPVLVGAGHAYELLLHMLQHFLRSGFGLKLLCDWVVFWNHGIEDREEYLRLVEESGIKGFSDMITLICCKYLGLDEKKVAWMELQDDYDLEGFLLEIIEAEEFGKSSVDRTVATRGISARDFLREFHHQMRLNFPKAGKVFLLWPILWGITFARFMSNNKKIRNTSFGAVICKAMKRSRMVEQLELFKEK